MRYLMAIFLAAFASAAMAAEPSYSCRPDQGCTEVQGPAYDIGPGATISLPSGWRLFSYPTAPIPVMAGLHEIRAIKDGMVIAISPFPNLDKRSISESYLCGLITKADAQYADQSKEKTVSTQSMTHDDLVGCYTSFTAAVDGEKPFGVLLNRHYASVSTFIISYKYIIYSVSLASEGAPDDAYLAALSAIQKIQ